MIYCQLKGTYMVYNWLINKLNSLIGQRCFLCEQTFAGSSADFCPHCQEDLPVVQPACYQCGIQLKSTLVSHCGRCLTKPPSYDRVISAFGYTNPIRQLMARYKFQHQLSLAPIFARALLARIKIGNPDIEALLPVPLHPIRLRQRGFNQAIELAQPIAKACQKPLLLNSIKRNRNTETQSDLSAKQRNKNLRGAFGCIQPLRHKSIAIIDDVMTTGSTVNELAKTLKQNGVEYVEVWCVARANIKNDI